MNNKRGYNLKKGTLAGERGRQLAHETKTFKKMRIETGSGGTKYKKRAEYGSRVNVKKYKPRKKA